MLLMFYLFSTPTESFDSMVGKRVEKMPIVIRDDFDIIEFGTECVTKMANLGIHVCPSTRTLRKSLRFSQSTLPDRSALCFRYASGMQISDLQTGLVKQENVVDVPTIMSPLGTRKILFTFRYKVRCRTTRLFDR